MNRNENESKVSHRKKTLWSSTRRLKHWMHRSFNIQITKSESAFKVDENKFPALFVVLYFKATDIWL